MIFAPSTADQIRLLTLGGKTPKDIAAVFELPLKEVRALIKREKWEPLEDIVLTTSVVEAAEEKSEMEKAMVVVSDSLAEGGKDHAKAVFSKVTAALKTLKKMPAIKTWKDVQIADSVARRAAGMDNDRGGGGKTIINLGGLAGAPPQPIRDPD